MLYRSITSNTHLPIYPHINELCLNKAYSIGSFLYDYLNPTMHYEILKDRVIKVKIQWL